MFETHRHRENNHMKTKGDMGEMWPQAKEFLEPSEFGKRGKNSPLEPLVGVWHSPHFGFRLLTLRQIYLMKE